jgi:hypothetical protein
MDPGVSDDPWVPDRGPVDGSPHTCMYQANPEPGCGAPGTWHIAWDEARQSITCDPHMTVVQQRWLYLDRHPLSPDCGMPGAVWLPDRCQVPGAAQEVLEAVELPTAVA